MGLLKYIKSLFVVDFPTNNDGTHPLIEPTDELGLVKLATQIELLPDYEWLDKEYITGSIDELLRTNRSFDYIKLSEKVKNGRQIGD